MRLRNDSDRSWRHVFKLVSKDLMKVALGLGVSILLAIWINPVVRQEVAEMLHHIPVAVSQVGF